MRPSDQKWVNSYTRLLLRKKNCNYHFYIKKEVNSSEIVTRLGSDGCKAETAYKSSNIESNNVNRRAKQSFFNTITATLQNYNNSAKRKLCILSRLMKIIRSSTSHQLLRSLDEQIVTDYKQKANINN